MKHIKRVKSKTQHAYKNNLHKDPRSFHPSRCHDFHYVIDDSIKNSKNLSRPMGSNKSHNNRRHAFYHSNSHPIRINDRESGLAYSVEDTRIKVWENCN